MPDEPAARVVHRELDTDDDAEDPAVQIYEFVEELEDGDGGKMGTMWECTDEVLQHMLSDPPEPRAQMTVTFSFNHYRITVEQDGTTELRKVESPA